MVRARLKGVMPTAASILALVATGCGNTQRVVHSYVEESGIQTEITDVSTIRPPKIRPLADLGDHSSLPIAVRYYAGEVDVPVTPIYEVIFDAGIATIRMPDREVDILLPAAGETKVARVDSTGSFVERVDGNPEEHTIKAKINAKPWWHGITVTFRWLSVTVLLIIFVILATRLIPKRGEE